MLLASHCIRIDGLWPMHIRAICCRSDRNLPKGLRCRVQEPFTFASAARFRNGLVLMTCIAGWVPTAGAFEDASQDSGGSQALEPHAFTPDAGTKADSGTSGPLLRIEDGKKAAQRGDWAQAEQAFADAMAMAPADVNVALAVGSAYYALGRVDSAIRTWTQALVIERSPDLLFNLGIAYRSRAFSRRLS